MKTQQALEAHTKAHACANYKTRFLPQWNSGEYYCPFGCIESKKPSEMASHLLQKHSETELAPWHLQKQKLREYL
jgi:hypothetical protein